MRARASIDEAVLENCGGPLDRRFTIKFTVAPEREGEEIMKNEGGEVES